MSVSFDDFSVVPSPKTAAERKAESRSRPENKERENGVKRAAGKEQRRERQLARPFIAWDGEGVTDNKGAHHYVLFAGKSPVKEISITDPNGIAAARIFDALLDMREACPDGIHILYGGNYDVNMFLLGMTRDELWLLRNRKFLDWGDYRLSWRPGKTFYVCRINSNGERVGQGVTVYDVVSFFQRPFVQACEEYLGADFPGRDIVVKNKRLRHGFSMADIDEIKAYNQTELSLLVQLADSLRARLAAADLLPSRWDGPGAIAAKLLTREGVKNALCRDIPEEVSYAARCAYFGGRFETIKFGHTELRAYEYDINSAYPSALRHVPNLNRGRWRHVQGEPEGHQDFALYRVSFYAYRIDLPGALPWREFTGLTAYPKVVDGWYWGPEIAAMREYCARDGGIYGEYEVHEAWLFDEDDSSDRPFGFIDELYRKRQALKRAGDGAHVAIKLGLNSMYGKLAQQLGATYERGEWKIPPFHQLEYAGFVTSHCRATVLRAVLPEIEYVIAFETDAVFMQTPLKRLPIGSDLGQWELTEFKNITYAQSGIYFGTLMDGAEVEKMRGVDRGTLPREAVVRAMGQMCPKDREVLAAQTRFVGSGVALTQSFERWRRWETSDRKVSVEPMGKRGHIPNCLFCERNENGLLTGNLHHTFTAVWPVVPSAPFDIMWVTDDSTAVERIRRTVFEEREEEWE